MSQENKQDPQPARRPIKFRVWDLLEGRFTNPDSGYQGHYCLSLSGEFVNLQNGSGGRECVVQQFTGLRDDNGTEIYEGDIVHCSDRAALELGGEVLAEVVWVADPGLGQSPQWSLRLMSHERAPVREVCRSLSGPMKIRGNIFEGIVSDWES